MSHALSQEGMMVARSSGRVQGREKYFGAPGGKAGRPYLRAGPSLLGELLGGRAGFTRVAPAPQPCGTRKGLIFRRVASGCHLCGASHFERKFRQQGKAIHRLAYERPEGASGEGEVP
jgi:hypothetical protein